MIYTVTFNPSLDYIVTVDNFREGATNRTAEELMLPGGKGINVSIVLSNLGVKNTAVYFSAGFVGREITRRIEECGITAEEIIISDGCSRINTKLRSVVTVNDKKRNIRKKDFLILAENLGITKKVAERLISQLLKMEQKIIKEVNQSYIPMHMQEELISLISNRCDVFK